MKNIFLQSFLAYFGSISNTIQLRKLIIFELIIFVYRLDKNDLLKKKQCYAPHEPEIFIANDYCDQVGIILSKNQSHSEDTHVRENNDRVS